MTKLTDTQLVILAAACQRPDRLVLPLPDKLKGGAATKVIESLAAKGMIEETDAKRGDPIWRETGEGFGVTLIATRVALEALGITDEAAEEAETQTETEATAAVADHSTDTQQPAAENAIENATEAATDNVTSSPKPKRQTREDSKQAKLIAMLRQPEGATIEEIVSALGWLPHTVRGAIAGALKKKLGLEVTSEKVESRGRCYRIA